MTANWCAHTQARRLEEERVVAEQRDRCRLSRSRTDLEVCAPSHEV